MVNHTIIHTDQMSIKSWSKAICLTLFVFTLSQMTLFKHGVIIGSHLTSQDIVVDDHTVQYHNLRFIIANEEIRCTYQPHQGLNLNLTRITHTQKSHPIGSLVKIYHSKNNQVCNIIYPDMVFVYSLFYYLFLVYFSIIGYTHIFLNVNLDAPDDL